MNYNYYDLISDYLSDTLDAETRRSFDRALRDDPEFAARVALERDLADALNSSSPENQLRANLHRISEKFRSPDDLKPDLPGEKMGGLISFGWAAVAGFLLLAGLAFWFFFQKKEVASQPPLQPKLESPKTTPVEKYTKPADSDFSKPSKSEPEKPVSPNRPRPIAASFRPIPQLEASIGSQFRGGDFRFRVAEPKSGITLHHQAGKTAFRLSGKMEGDAPADASFNALIFSNNLQNFEAMRPLKSSRLDFAPGGEFSWAENLQMSPGLYYLLIEERQSGEWLFVDKFWVR